MFRSMVFGANGIMSKLDKKRKQGEGASSLVSEFTQEDPARATVESTEKSIEQSISVAERRRQRRQKQTRGNNPFSRGVETLG